MKPSVVRVRILREHEEIRALVLRVGEAIGGLRSGAPDAVATARGACSALAERLFEHIDLEDAILAPALRDADAWGPEREQALLRHHREQRAELGALADLSSLGAVEIAARLERLVADLHADMQHEEKALLDPDLLRDDVVAIDVSDG